jgi:hypothetical protein
MLSSTLIEYFSGANLGNSFEQSIEFLFTIYKVLKLNMEQIIKADRLRASRPLQQKQSPRHTKAA